MRTSGKWDLGRIKYVSSVSNERRTLMGLLVRCTFSASIREPYLRPNGFCETWKMLNMWVFFSK